MKHGRDTRGVAPASDVAGHDDARGTPLPTHPAMFGHMVFFFFLADLHRHGYDSGRFVLNWANLGRINRNHRFRTKFKKKKKKVQNSPFEINIKNLTSTHFTQTPNFSCLSSHFVSHSSLCSLLSVLSASVSLPLWL